MKCKKCGAELRKGIKFCVQCGERIENGQTEEETRNAEKEIHGEQVRKDLDQELNNLTGSTAEKKFGDIERDQKNGTMMSQEEEKNRGMNQKTEPITEKKNVIATILNVVATIYLTAVVYSGCAMIGGDIQAILNYLLLNIVIIVLLYGLAQVVQLLTDIKNKMSGR